MPAGRKSLVAGLRLHHVACPRCDRCDGDFDPLHCLTCSTPGTLVLWPCDAIQAADLLDPPNCQHEQWVPYLVLQKDIGNHFDDEFPFCLRCGITAAEVAQ